MCCTRNYCITAEQSKNKVLPEINVIIYDLFGWKKDIKSMLKAGTSKSLLQKTLTKLKHNAFQNLSHICQHLVSVQ